MSHMRRRAFVTLLGAAAVCPFPALAQKSDGVRRVGVIMGFAENDEVWQAYLASFRQGLQELGWTDATFGSTTASPAKARNVCAPWPTKWSPYSPTPFSSRPTRSFRQR